MYFAYFTVFSGLKIIINKKMGFKVQVFVNNKLSSQGELSTQLHSVRKRST